MYPRLYALIEQAVSEGVPAHTISSTLIEDGWPEQAVNEALSSWLAAHGRVNKSTSFKEWIKKYYRKAAPAAVAVVFINIIAVGINLLRPWPLKILADSGFGNTPAPGFLEPYTGTPTIILYTSLMTISLFVVGTIFGTIRNYTLLKIGFWLNYQIKHESLRHIMHLPLFHQERLSKGDYVYRQNVVTNSLSDLVLGSTSSIAESVIVIIGVLGILFVLNPSLAIIAVVLLPLLFVSIRFIGPRMGFYARQLTEVASETSSRINESVDNAETVQAFTLENKLLTKIGDLWKKSYELSRKSLLWGELLSSTNGFFIVIATALVMYIGGTAVMDGRLTIGELLIFITYMNYLLDPAENLVNQITTRNQKIIDVGRIHEVLTDHEGIEDLRNDKLMPLHVSGAIEFQNVTYSYKDNVVLENVSLKIPAQQKVGIIGPSGGGKSTLLKMLPLFIQPENGRIYIDNIDIQTVSLQDLRQRIAWVSQAPQLFDGTILENLMDGDVNQQPDRQEIIDAIETANVSEFAAKLPMGLASPAGENGGSLSGGQRQRVAIARALIKDAPVVCLDEPTAALDTKSENQIRDSLESMINGKTVVMVTHRRPLLSLMDVIYVLEDGTLTDVNNLGGLEAYLARLDNIEAAEQEESPTPAHQENQQPETVNTQPVIAVASLLEQYEAFNQARAQAPLPAPKASDIQHSTIYSRRSTDHGNDETILRLH